jgi:hypothetical protein
MTSQGWVRRLLKGGCFIVLCFLSGKYCRVVVAPAITAKAGPEAAKEEMVHDVRRSTAKQQPKFTKQAKIVLPGC